MEEDFSRTIKNMEVCLRDKNLDQDTINAILINYSRMVFDLHLSQHNFDSQMEIRRLDAMKMRRRG